MSTLTPTGLETADYGTLGWNYIYSTNFEKLNEYLSKFPYLWDVSSYTPNDGDLLMFSSETGLWDSGLNKSELVLWSDIDLDGDRLIDSNKIQQGDGSGLNADTVDGIQGSDIMKISVYDSDGDGVLSVNTIPNNQVNLINTSNLLSSSGIFLVDASTGDITINLPTTIDNGSIFTIKKIDNTANIVTITVDGIITIDGSVSIDLLNQYDKVSVVYYNGSYYII